MAGQRRGPRGSGQPTRQQTRAAERKKTLASRLRAAKTPAERVSWAAAHLRAVMKDPQVTVADADHAGRQAEMYLLKLAEQLEARSA